MTLLMVVAVAKAVAIGVHLMMVLATSPHLKIAVVILVVIVRNPRIPRPHPCLFRFPRLLRDIE